MPGRHPGSPQALLFRDREKKRKPPPGEEEGLEPGEDSLEAERKIPLKLSRRGERGGDSWQKGNTLLGDPGLVRGLMGADTGLEGRCGGPREQKKPLEGLPMLWGLSTCGETDGQEGGEALAFGLPSTAPHLETPRPRR